MERERLRARRGGPIAGGHGNTGGWQPVISGGCNSIKPEESDGCKCLAVGKMMFGVFDVQCVLGCSVCVLKLWCVVQSVLDQCRFLFLSIPFSVFFFFYCNYQMDIKINTINFIVQTCRNFKISVTLLSAKLTHKKSTK